MPSRENSICHSIHVKKRKPPRHGGGAASRRLVSTEVALEGAVAAHHPNDRDDERRTDRGSDRMRSGKAVSLGKHFIELCTDVLHVHIQP